MRQLQLVSDIALRISSVRGVDDLLWEVVRLIQATFGYYYVHVCLVDRTRHVAECRAGWDSTGPRRDLLGWSLRLRDQGIVGWVAWSGEPLLAPDVRKEARYYLDPRFPHTASEVTVPIKRGQETIGILDAQHRRLHAFDEDDMRLLEALGRQVAVALENATLFEQLSESQQALDRQARSLDQFVELAASAQEEERRRIALDLHDGVAQLLAGARFEIETIRTASPRPAHSLAEQLEFISGVLNECSAEMRGIVFDLYPPGLENLGLVPTIQRYVETFRRLARVDCTVTVRGAVRRLLAYQELASFRFAQEALANVFKHAVGASAEIRVEFGPSSLAISVIDQGPGFDSARLARKVESYGFQSMQRNAMRAGGHLTISSEPGSGSSVALVVPT